MEPSQVSVKSTALVQNKNIVFFFFFFFFKKNQYWVHICFQIGTDSSKQSLYINCSAVHTSLFEF